MTRPARAGVLATLSSAALFGLAGPAFAHADLTGVWMIQPAYYLGKPLDAAPELTPAARATAEKRNAAQAVGYVRSVGNMLCLPSGGPQLFRMRTPFEIFEGFGRLTFIFETEGSNQPRTVYLGEKTHPEDLFKTFNGHSIGRWEGETLVVDTIAYNGRGALMGPVNKSEDTHVVERFSLSPDGQVLTALVTMEDPVSLAKPWTVTLKFDRKDPSEERFEVWCEPDLEAFRRVDLQAVKDFDPEVARLLDPALNASDPALKIGGGQ